MPKLLVRKFITYVAAEKAVIKAGYSEVKGGNPITTGVWFTRKNKTGMVKKVVAIFRATTSTYKATYYIV